MCWPLSGGGSGSPCRSGSVCTLPPRVGLASRRVTSWPASTSSSAADSPARPPPTTTTLISGSPTPTPSPPNCRVWTATAPKAPRPLNGSANNARSSRERGSDHAQLADRRQRRRAIGDVANDVDQLQGDAQRLGALGLVGSIDRNARAPDRPGDARAVTAQLVEIRVARLFGVLDAAVDQRRERLPRNRESFPRVGKSDEHRLLARRCFESPPKLLQENALFLFWKRPVRKVVDTPRKRIDGSNCAPLRPR